jgi:chromate transporter
MAWIFARISVSTLGSGNTTTALLGEELVERRGWLNRHQFSLSYALARATPGTNLLGFCTGAGWFMRGVPGALVALLSVSLPASAIALLLTVGYEGWHGHWLGAAAISSAVASIVGVIAAGAWLLIRPALSQESAVRTGVIVLGSLFLSFYYEIAPIRVIALAALVGYFWPERRTP